MRAVLRLVYTYFTATPVARALTLGGLALWVIAFYILTTQAQSAEKLWLGILGVLAIFLGSTQMPLMMGRLARSHAMTIMPFGRLKLLASAFLTILLVSLPVAVLTPFAFGAGVSVSQADWWRDPRLVDFLVQLGGVAFTSTFILAGWLYLALWFITHQRNLAGFAKGLAVIAFIVFVPAREVHDLKATITEQLQQIVVAWTIFGAGFLLWQGTQGFRERWGMGGARRAGQTSRRIEGREIAWLLGTANPWLFIAAQTLPILITARSGIYDAAVWLYFLTIFSAVAGAMAGQAAPRSRVLWLRTPWSRAELFANVERAYLRHNGYVLGAMSLLMVAIVIYAGSPASLLMAGLPLLILGAVLSTYLGLMITRGLQWMEAMAGVVVMLVLMALAIHIVEQPENPGIVFIAEGLLVAAAFALRGIARRRWMQIDWMESRADRALAGRGAA